MANRSNNDSHVPTQADLDRSADALYEQHQNNISSHFHIGKDGKIFGFEVPKEAHRFINAALAPVTQALSTSASSTVGWLAATALNSTLLQGKVSEANKTLITNFSKETALWGVLALRPIMEGFSLARERTTSYMALVGQTRQICDEVGADYSHNGVIKVAHRAYNQSWDLKKLIPGIIQFVATIPSGVQKRQAIWNTNAAASATQQAVAAGKPLRSKNDIAKEFYANSDYQNMPQDVRQELLQELYRDAGHAVPVPVVQNTHTPQTHGHMQQGNNAAENLILNLLDPKTWPTTLPAAASFFSTDIESWARRDEKKNRKPLNSYELIQDLHERVTAGSSNVLANEIVKIFQQYEKDQGHPELASAPLNNLYERAQVIAQAMASHKINARAMIRLVGEDMVIDHSSSGRHIKSAEEIEQAINLVAASTVSAKAEMSKGEFLGRFEKTELVEQAIRKNLSELKESTEKDFFVALMPAEILEMTGLNKKEIRQHRINAQNHLYENIAAGVIHLATKNEEVLKAYGMSFKEIQYLQAVSQQIMQGHKDKVKQLVENREDGLTNLVAAGLLAEQVEGKKDTWAERVSEGNRLDQTIEKIVAEKKEKHRHAPEGEHMPHSARHEHHDGHQHREDKRIASNPNTELGM